MNLGNRIIDEELSNRNSTKVQVCDGFGCANESEENIAVSAGTFGTISLNLCSRCIFLFKPKDLSNPTGRMDTTRKTCFSLTESVT